VLDLKGDGRLKASGRAAGGWEFQYNNAHYPDSRRYCVVVIVETGCGCTSRHQE